MREELSKIYDSISNSKIICPPEILSVIENYLSLYSQLDEVEECLATNSAEREKIKNGDILSGAIEDYNKIQAWLKVVPSEPDLQYYLDRNYKRDMARFYKETIDHYEAEIKDLTQTIETLELQKIKIQSQLPRTKEDEKALTDDILNQIEQMLANCQSNLASLKESILESRKESTDSQPGEE